MDTAAPGEPIVGALDAAVAHIFGAGLDLAAILSLRRVDDEVATRLDRALTSLDAAIAGLRTAALAHTSDAAVTLIPAAQPKTLNGRRRLTRFSVAEDFAYAVGSYDFYRAADHTLWAHESQGLLLSARSGTPLARRNGNVFYDIDTDTPLYFEDGGSISLRNDEPA